MTWKGVKVNEENLSIYCFVVGAVHNYVLGPYGHMMGGYGPGHGHDGRIWLWIWRYVYGDTVFNCYRCSDLPCC